MSIARKTVAELADKIKATVADRGANYGMPEANFANIAALWNAWIRARHNAVVLLDGHDVGQMCALMKIARLAQRPTHADSALDAAVYAMLGFGVALSDAAGVSADGASDHVSV